MNNEEAVTILQAHLSSYRQRTYSELVALMGQPQVAEVQGSSGTKYQLEVEVFWDSAAGGDIRVLGSVDDGGWRAFKPLCEDFILAPNGAFVGE